MAEFPFLSVVTFLPLVGALMVLVFSGDDPIAVRNIRWTSLWVTTIATTHAMITATTTTFCCTLETLLLYFFITFPTFFFFPPQIRFGIFCRGL